jgi:hypothetical protein
MDLRPGEAGLLHESHEVLEDMRQNVFESGVGVGGAHLIYVTFTVN